MSQDVMDSLRSLTNFSKIKYFNLSPLSGEAIRFSSFEMDSVVKNTVKS